MLLLTDLDRVVGERSLNATVLFVDDGSTDGSPAAVPRSLSHIERVEILELRRNVGHQRAIALGLAYIHDERPCSAVVVMDGDGEDSAEGALKLIDALGASDGRHAIFAQRRRRTEGFIFRGGYLLFKLIHALLTGRGIDVGNFSILPFSAIQRLVAVSEMWNHYAAAVIKSRQPMIRVPIDRQHRYKGQSHMNLTSLVVHGLSAISVYGDEVGVRLLGGAFGLGTITFAGLLAVIWTPLVSDTVIPGWTMNAIGILAVLMISFAALSMVFVMFVLHSRQMLGFLPLRDYRTFILRRRDFHEGTA